MSKSDETPEDLIERAEREAGCRVDDPNNPNALAILLGSLARELGQHQYQPKYDVVAGTLIMHQLGEAMERERQRDRIMLLMLALGIDPDTLKELG